MSYRLGALFVAPGCLGMAYAAPIHRHDRSRWSLTLRAENSGGALGSFTHQDAQFGV